MNTYISILRGINVSGKNLIKMNSLLEMYKGLGFKNVRTYIQSGNVIFQENEVQSAELEKKISNEILNQFSLKVPVLVREKTDLKNILEMNPFKTEIQDSFERLYITLLSDEPESKYLENLEKIEYAPEKYVVNGRTIYLHCPNGYGNTKLNNNFFENKLKVTATTRNMKTITELVKMSEL